MSDLPGSVERHVRGLDAVPVTIGESRARILRFDRDETPRLFLKIAEHPVSAAELAREHARLNWLADRTLVPEVVEFARDDESAWLLTTALPGHDATVEMRFASPHRVIELLIDSMRQLHHLSIEDCPFDHAWRVEIDRVTDALGAGLVSVHDFDADREGRPVKEVMKELREQLADHQYEPVFTHGDFCLPNVIVNGGEFGGYVDLGLAGVGDRYRDLAACAMSVRRNLGEAFVQPFFDRYAIADLDTAKLELYKTLDSYTWV